MNTHSLIQKSIDEYTCIQALMESIVDLGMNSRVEKLSEAGTALLNKQRSASHTDRRIMQLLNESPDLRQDVKILERTELLKSVLRLNKHILPRLESIKSLMSSELQQIKNGRFAIKGYQQVEKKHGRNINNAL